MTIAPTAGMAASQPAPCAKRTTANAKQATRNAIMIRYRRSRYAISSERGRRASVTRCAVSRRAFGITFTVPPYAVPRAPSSPGPLSSGSPTSAGNTFSGGTMTDRTYRVTEIVGTSPEGIEPAIRNALHRAGQTLRHLDWFEVTEIRGQIQDDRVAHYQVGLKVGFRLEDA